MSLSATIIAALSTFLLIAFGCLATEDYLAAAVLLLALVAPLAGFVFIKALAWKEPYASSACILLIFILSAVFRIRDIDDKSLDAQVISKIVCIGWMAMMAASAHLRRRSSFNSYSKLTMLLLICAYMYIESINAVNPSIAFVEAGSNIIAALFLIGIVERLGPSAMIQILLSACSLMSITSLVVYFVFPDLGRMTDWVNDTYTTTLRLQGVFGTPNAAGASAAFCLLVIVLFRQNTNGRARVFFQAVLFAVVLLMTNNRMAIAALIGAAGIFFVCKRGTVLSIAVGTLAIAFGTLFYGQYGDQLLAIASRSGDVSEITSGTGRAEIWSVVWDLCLKQPLLGYGVGSAKFILPHHPLLFGAAAHAHNLYLNVLFAGGAVGLAVLLATISTALYRAWSKRFDRVLTIIGFFLLYGMTEPVIGGLASFVSMAFLSALLLSDCAECSVEALATSPTYGRGVLSPTGDGYSMVPPMRM